jgi:hypothetical protein
MQGKVAKEVPLSEITLRRYERPNKLKGRELAKKLCLGLGLLQPGDSRDVVIDVLYVLLIDRELKCSDIEKKVIGYRQENKLPILGVTSSNVRRQLKRLRELFLIEKKKNVYRITENAPMLETFQEKYEKFLLQSCVSRVKDYLEAIDKEFKPK